MHGQAAGLLSDSLRYIEGLKSSIEHLAQLCSSREAGVCALHDENAVLRQALEGLQYDNLADRAEFSRILEERDTHVEDVVQHKLEEQEALQHLLAEQRLASLEHKLEAQYRMRLQGAEETIQSLRNDVKLCMGYRKRAERAESRCHALFAELQQLKSQRSGCAPLASAGPQSIAPMQPSAARPSDINMPSNAAICANPLPELSPKHVPRSSSNGEQPSDRLLRSVLPKQAHHQEACPQKERHLHGIGGCFVFQPPQGPDSQGGLTPDLMHPPSDKLDTLHQRHPQPIKAFNGAAHSQQRQQKNEADQFINVEMCVEQPHQGQQLDVKSCQAADPCFQPMHGITNPPPCSMVPETLYPFDALILPEDRSQPLTDISTEPVGHDGVSAEPGVHGDITACPSQDEVMADRREAAAAVLAHSNDICADRAPANHAQDNSCPCDGRIAGSAGEQPTPVCSTGSVEICDAKLALPKELMIASGLKPRQAFIREAGEGEQAGDNFLELPNPRLINRADVTANACIPCETVCTNREKTAAEILDEVPDSARGKCVARRKLGGQPATTQGNKATYQVGPYPCCGESGSLESEDLKGARKESTGELCPQQSIPAPLLGHPESEDHLSQPQQGTPGDSRLLSQDTLPPTPGTSTCKEATRSGLQHDERPTTPGTLPPSTCWTLPPTPEECSDQQQQLKEQMSTTPGTLPPTPESVMRQWQQPSDDRQHAQGKLCPTALASSFKQVADTLPPSAVSPQQVIAITNPTAQLEGAAPLASGGVALKGQGSAVDRTASNRAAWPGSSPSWKTVRQGSPSAMHVPPPPPPPPSLLQQGQHQNQHQLAQKRNLVLSPARPALDSIFNLGSPSHTLRPSAEEQQRRSVDAKRVRVDCLQEASKGQMAGAPSTKPGSNQEGSNGQLRHPTSLDRRCTGSTAATAIGAAGAAANPACFRAPQTENASCQNEAGTSRKSTIWSANPSEARKLGGGGPSSLQGPRAVSHSPTNAPNGFKYTEVVRKKAERELLKGFDCPQCRQFYEALASWGHAVIQPPSCGHAPAAASLQGPASGQVDNNAGPVDVALPQRFQQDVSRHRYRYAPPATPAGFWDMGFNDSLDSRFGGESQITP